MEAKIEWSSLSQTVEKLILIKQYPQMAHGMPIGIKALCFGTKETRLLCKKEAPQLTRIVLKKTQKVRLISKFRRADFESIAFTISPKFINSDIVFSVRLFDFMNFF